MRFLFSEDLETLREGTRSFLEGRNPAERLRQQDSPSLWGELVEMGLLDITDSLPLAESVALFEEVGRVALPEPLADTAAIAVPVLRSLDAAAKRASTSRVAVCHPLCPFANQAADADHILYFDVDRVLLLKPEEAELATQESIDPWRTLSTVRPIGGEVIAESSGASDFAAALGAVAASAELLGLADRMIRMATDYAATREQFGKPIGTFQAVKHLLANAQVKLEFARPVVYRAGFALETPGLTRDIAVAHAKVAATDAAIFAAEQAIQVHGGMGYTFEADLHFFMKRTWALAAIWGSREHHLGVIDQGLFTQSVGTGPQNSFQHKKANGS